MVQDGRWYLLLLETLRTQPRSRAAAAVPGSWQAWCDCVGCSCSDACWLLSCVQAAGRAECSPGCSCGCPALAVVDLSGVLEALEQLGDEETPLRGGALCLCLLQGTVSSSRVAVP